MPRNPHYLPEDPSTYEYTPDRHADDAHKVYRLYDSTGVLLYVGCTYQFHRRMQEHARRSPWYSQIHKATAQSFPDRASARASERTAVAAESPVYNVLRYPPA